MAVAVASTSTLTGAVRTNSTLTAPSGIANGNLLLAFVAVGDAGDSVAPTVTPPAGFTAITGSPFSIVNFFDSGYGIALNIFSKVASGESGSYTFTHGSANSQGFMYRLTGQHATTPINPTATTATFNGNGGGGTTPTAPSITTVTDGALVIYAVLVWDGVGASPPAGTTPTFTERLDATSVYIADGVMSPAGATGAKSTTMAGQSNGSAYRAVLVAVDAAAGGGGSGKPVKVWSGSAWVTKPVKVWSGSAWVAKPAKVWNGSAWV